MTDKYDYSPLTFTAMKKYIQKIKDEFKRCGRKLKENLDKPYRLRGYNREAALSIGKPIVYDRVAAMYVSLFILHHFRTNTTICLLYTSDAADD